jgi:hypothetical protein
MLSFNRQAIVERLAEPSTWRGLFMIATARNAERDRRARHVDRRPDRRFDQLQAGLSRI